ncbi:hypothetical protein [Streptomyces sp. NPDC046909]|uniref:hypothetical protein n=1 Tax=Streptomyces sp. NPDC046909 TaxID=3155617 RepID=UPI0033D5266B
MQAPQFWPQPGLIADRAGTYTATAAWGPETSGVQEHYLIHVVSADKAASDTFRNFLRARESDPARPPASTHSPKLVR